MAISNPTSVLDNPIWNALSTCQAHFAEGDGHARRFNAEIGPLSGLRDQSPESYTALRRLLTPGQPAILFLEEPPRLPEGWRLLRHETLAQMICPDAPVLPSAWDHGTALPIEPLDAASVPEMIELVKLTEPGPFGRRTIEFGGYLGIRQNGRLAAMGGQRLAPPGCTEVSAVCTHPDFRGRGYAQLLVAEVAHQIRERGETPFLTSLASNTRAIRVYESAGFVLRRTLELAVVTPAAPEH